MDRKIGLAAALSFSVMALSACNTVEPTEETVIDLVEEETLESESIISPSGDIPLAYQDILARCSEIIEYTEDGYCEMDDSLGSLYWFADQCLHPGGGNPHELYCYSLTDMNEDGIDELILASKYPEENGSIASRAGYSIFNIYTLDGDEAVLLAESYLHSSWFINSDGLFINERSSTPAYHEIVIYSFEADSTALTEEYHVYNSYSEDRSQVELYEAADGGSAELINVFDDPNSDDLWAVFSEVRSNYTADLYSIELVPICC